MRGLSTATLAVPPGSLLRLPVPSASRSFSAAVTGNFSMCDFDRFSRAMKLLPGSLAILPGEATTAARNRRRGVVSGFGNMKVYFFMLKTDFADVSR